MSSHQKYRPSGRSKEILLIKELKRMLQAGQEFAKEGGRTIIFTIDPDGKSWIMLGKCRHGKQFNADLGGSFHTDNFIGLTDHKDFMNAIINNTLRELREETCFAVDISLETMMKCPRVIEIYTTDNKDDRENGLKDRREHGLNEQRRVCDRREHGYGLFLYVKWDTFNTIREYGTRNIEKTTAHYRQTCQEYKIFNIDELKDTPQQIWDHYRPFGMGGYIETAELTVFSLQDIYEHSRQQGHKNFLNYEGELDVIAWRAINLIVNHKEEIKQMFQTEPLGHTTNTAKINNELFGEMEQVVLTF